MNDVPEAVTRSCFNASYLQCIKYVKRTSEKSPAITSG